MDGFRRNPVLLNPELVNTNSISIEYITKMIHYESSEFIKKTGHLVATELDMENLKDCLNNKKSKFINRVIINQGKRYIIKDIIFERNKMEVTWKLNMSLLGG